MARWHAWRRAIRRQARRGGARRCAASSKRGSRASVVLSARESEVCLGLLTGKMLREMADELGVKEGPVETCIKRAAVKLGISGRHGLTKWMIDDSAPCASAA